MPTVIDILNSHQLMTVAEKQVKAEIVAFALFNFLFSLLFIALVTTYRLSARGDADKVFFTVICIILTIMFLVYEVSYGPAAITGLVAPDYRAIQLIQQLIQ